MSTATVDASAGGGRVLVDIDVTDLAAAGVSPVGIDRVRIHWDRSNYGEATKFYQPMPLTGSTWRGVMIVAAGALPNTMTIDRITLRDKQWNRWSYSRPDDYSGPIAPGLGIPDTWQTTIQVTDDDPDVRGPEIVGVTFSPRAVDTRKHPAYLKVAIRARDDRQLLGARFGLRRGGDPEYETYLWSTLTTRRGGLFTGTLRVPRWLNQDSRFAHDDGVWHALAEVWDANRTRRVAGDAIAAHGWPSTVRVLSTVKPYPTIVSIAVGKPVPKADGSVRVPVRALADGQGAPVKEVAIALYHWPNWATGWGTTRLARISGNTRHGTWTGTVTVGRCAGPGRYGIWADLKGLAARNWNSNYTLVRRGAPKVLILPTLTGDDLPPSADLAVVAADHLAVQFSEPVRDILPALSLVTTTTKQPIPVASITCAQADGTPVNCSGGDALTRRADFALQQPLDLAAGATLLVNTTVALPQITDQAGNPLQEETSKLSFMPPED